MAAAIGKARYPTEHPVTPGDLCATVYQLLGLDPHMMVPDQTGRPLHVAHGGEPIRGDLGVRREIHAARLAF